MRTHTTIFLSSPGTGEDVRRTGEGLEASLHASTLGTNVKPNSTSPSPPGERVGVRGLGLTLERAR